MQLDRTFTAAELPQSDSDYEPIPAGWYVATIAGAEVKQTKAGNGAYIAVRFDVTGPTHQGRVVFTNINISNPNPEAEKIAHQQLGSLLRSINLESLSDTDQLIGASCQIKVSIRKSEEYGDRNEIKAFKAGARASVDDIPLPGESPAAAAAAPPPWAS